jgi:regulator of protease activity HflC (stomatin/prohibitin superfamily)
MENNFAVRSFIDLKHNTSGGRRFHLICCTLGLIVIPIFLLVAFWHKTDAVHMPIAGKMIIYWEWSFFSVWTSVAYSLCFLQKNKSTGEIELTRVPAGYVGMLMFGGQPIREFGPGIVPAPPGFELKIDTAEPLTETFEISGIDTGTPETVNYDELKISKDAFKDDELHARMSNLRMKGTIIYQVETGKYADFILNLRDIGNFQKNVQSFAIRALGGMMNQLTTAIALSNRDRLDSGLKKFFQGKVEGEGKPWGLKIITAQVDDIELPMELADLIEEKMIFKIRKFMMILDAESRKKVVELDAEATEFKEIREGRGRAKAEGFMLKVKAVGRKLMLEAEAIGYARIAKELGITEGELVLKIEAMNTAFKETLSNANYSYLGGTDMGNFLGFIPMLKDAISKTTPMK